MAIILFNRGEEGERSSQVWEGISRLQISESVSPLRETLGEERKGKLPAHEKNGIPVEKAPRGRTLTGSGGEDKLPVFEGITVDGETGGSDGWEVPKGWVCYRVREKRKRYLPRFSD